MRPAWRLAITSASARRSRTALLVGAVALSAALIAAVATALNSLNASVQMRTEATVGRGDVRIQPAGSGQTLDDSILEHIRAWPEVELAAAKLEGRLATLAIRKPILVRESDGWKPRDQVFIATDAQGNGIEPGLEDEVRPLRLLAGRGPQRDDEIVIDALLAMRLGYDVRTAEDRRYGFDVVKPRTIRERLKPHELPSGRISDAQAERFNRGQGVRIGDKLNVVPSAVAPAQLLAFVPRLATGPNAFVGFANAANFGPGGLLDMARLLISPRRLVEQIELLRRPVQFTVVGIAEQPPLGGRPQAYLTLNRFQQLADQPGRISQVDVIVKPGASPDDVSDAHREELGAGIIIQSTEKITSDLEKNIKSSQLGFLLASVLAFLSASFIIMTGLTTDVSQRQRELAVVRCIGGRRRQLAEAQFATGVMVGGLGALIGIPAGVAVAWLIARAFPETVPSGVIVPRSGVLLALVGSLGAGVAGAAFPAWRASTMPPLTAMRSHARPATRKGIVLTTVLGLLGVAFHLAVVLVPSNSQFVFWTYVIAALPLMFVGYFLLGVAAVLTVSRALAPVVSGLLRIPRRLLLRGLGGTPYRYGFTAGAMMTGLALMVAIWTNGRAVLRDWIDAMEFPDAFVSGIPLSPQAKGVLDALPFVENSCAITREFVEVGADATLGVRGLQRYDTSFIGFEPQPFFEMTNLTWVEGSREYAQPRLEAGGAVLIAREFHVARGLGVGDTFTCTFNGKEFTFDIVGVVTSPGLDIASRFFNIGEEYTHQAVHSVFGSLKDLREKFRSDQTHILQVDLADGVDDMQAISAIRNALAPYGLLDAGSGRQLKERIHQFAKGTLMVFSCVAIVAMLVACFGVANLIAAAIDVRQFEFGVLRAVGAHRNMLARLVAGEALLVALSASLMGTVMGIQAALGGRRLYEALLGIQFDVRPPLMPILAGWATVVTLTLLAAAPAAVRLNRRRPRELLAVVKG